MMKSDSIHIESQICEGQQLDKQQGSTRDVRVTVLQGGASINGYYYGEAPLRTITHLINNAQAYVDHARIEHDSPPAPRSVRDMIGFYHSASYQPPDENSPQGRVDAILHVLESADWLWSMICEASALGHPDLIGLSIDIYGTWRPLTPSDPSTTDADPSTTQSLKEVTSVLALNSCDVVTRPSAGGAFHRPPQTTPGALPMHEETQIPPPADNNQPPPTLLTELRIERSQLLLERRLLESTLPEPLKRQVRSRYQGRFFETAELDQDLNASRQLMADLASAGLIRNHNYEKPEISTQVTEAEKIQAAFDRMFDLDINTSRMGNIQPFTSIREAYARVTGDPAVNGFMERTGLGTTQISESAPITRITETDTTTVTFSYLLGTSMNKRLLKDYEAWPAEWTKFCTVTPIRDFKQQTRIRLGAFGSLSTVAEDTAYTTVTLNDSAATYVPAKRGNLVSISRETIVNDDLHAIKQIPTKLAVAAAYTLAEFVYGFLSTNPTIYDSNPLFMTGTPHNNLGVAALSTSAMQTGVTAMREQTNFANKRIGLRPRFLVVPPELEWTSMVVTKSAGIPGSPNNDINPMLGYVTPIVSPQLTSSTQWFLIADPREVDTLEIGFVGGQINPALFIQDQPLYGLNFTQDAISYKIRHEYGGAVVDFRGLYRGI